jgi:hypothetical protein
MFVGEPLVALGLRAYLARIPVGARTDAIRVSRRGTVADACVENLTERARRVNSIGGTIRELLREELHISRQTVVLVFAMAALATDMRDLMRKCLDEGGPDLSQAARDPAAAQRIRELLSEIRVALERVAGLAVSLRKIIDGNLVYGLAARYYVNRPLSQARSLYEDFHAFAVSYLNDGQGADTVAWEDLARSIG